MQKMRAASYSDIGGREQNEDSVKLIRWEDGAVCAVVADGLGGHGGGERASAAVTETVCERWKGEISKEILSKMILEAHRKIADMQTAECAMKSTVVILILKDSQAMWAHVGDSRLYHFKDGIKCFQTKDHSASQIAVTLGEITADQIRFHEDRNRVLRALGQDDRLRIEYGFANLEKGRHAFLLCSDGFWEYVLEEEMEKSLEESDNPVEWIKEMRQILANKVPDDNDNNTAAAVWTEI